MARDAGDSDDRDLVAAVARRDEAAMAEVVRRHRGAVVAFARRLVGDDGRAEEIAQEVFVRLWERPERFDVRRGSLRSFLVAVAHSRSLDVMRSDAARRGRELRDAARTAPPDQGVEGELVARTVADGVRRALERLPASERRAVELAYLGGHSYRAVARLLDEPEGTVKSRIRSGLARLRAELATTDLVDP